jgi:hypothetical protein
VTYRFAFQHSVIDAGSPQVPRHAQAGLTGADDHNVVMLGHAIASREEEIAGTVIVLSKKVAPLGHWMVNAISCMGGLGVTI